MALLKVVCHGDSLTEGEDIESDLRWTSLVASDLNMEIINTFMLPLSGFGKCFEKLKELVAKIKETAVQNEILCLDFWRLFYINGVEIDGSLFLEDCLHPNQAGHRRMAELASEQIRKMQS